MSSWYPWQEGVSNVSITTTGNSSGTLWVGPTTISSPIQPVVATTRLTNLDRLRERVRELADEGHAALYTEAA